MLDADDYFSEIHKKLGLHRASDLTKIQTILDDWYPLKARAKRLHEGKLYIITESSSVANDLRLRQIELLDVIHIPVEQLIITQSNR